MFGREVLAPRRVPALILGVPEVLIITQAHHTTRLTDVRLLAARAGQLVNDSSGAAPAVQAGGAGMAPCASWAGGRFEGRSHQLALDCVPI